MTPSGIITLLTDFGVTDPFVGVMKGVILTRFRDATIVDLSHGIPPQDIAAAAFWIERSFRWFPPGTVHVVVIDPGVGGKRAALAAQANGHLFVAPDNGVLGDLPGITARAIDVAALGLPEPSRTFHGRDVFAPVAADLASGQLALAGVGAKKSRIERLALTRPNGATGRVVVVDRFGNLITDIEPALLSTMQEPRAHVAGTEVAIVGTYSEAKPGELVGVINAFGTLEIARRDGNAAAHLGVGPGTAVGIFDARPGS